MNRIQVIQKTRDLIGEEGILLSNIGDPSKELFAAGDRDKNFYMLGSMGLVSSIGLGIALANERKVVALDGDGSIFMNMGTLVTIAKEAPSNFKLVILDNGANGSTGYQKTAISEVGNIAEIAKACGNQNVREVSNLDLFEETFCEFLAGDFPSIIVAKINREHDPRPIIPISGVQIKERFMSQVEDTVRA